MDSATPCFCVCVCVIPVLKLKHSSPCFTHKIQFPSGVQIITHEEDIVTPLVLKTTPSDS